MSEYREKFAEAVHDELCHHELNYRECIAIADRVLASDALAQMLAEAEARGRDHGFAEGHFPECAGAYDRGKRDGAAEVRARVEAWLSTQVDSLGGQLHLVRVADLQAALPAAEGEES